MIIKAPLQNNLDATFIPAWERYWVYIFYHLLECYQLNHAK